MRKTTGQCENGGHITEHFNQGLKLKKKKVQSGVCGSLAQIFEITVKTSIT